MSNEELEEYMKQVEPNFNSHIEKGTIEMNNEFYNLVQEKMARLINENQKYKEVIDNLKDKLMEYFEVGGDCYFYVLTRDKSAFYYGTMSFDDFKEFNEEQVDDIIDFLKEVEI